MLTRKQKENIVKELKDKLKKMKSVIFTDFTGLKVDEMGDLRRRLREQNIEYQVVKKSLLKRVFPKIDYPGSVAIALSYDDQIAPARILNQFSQEHENLKIISGILDDKKLSQEEVLALANLPSKEELLTKVIGSIQGPIAGLINALKGNIEKLLLILTRRRPDSIGAMAGKGEQKNA